METTSANILTFPSGEETHKDASSWITAYTQDVLAAKDGATIEAYCMATFSRVSVKRAPMSLSASARKIA
jgi:hypothetical protein